MKSGEVSLKRREYSKANKLPECRNFKSSTESPQPLKLSSQIWGSVRFK